MPVASSNQPDADRNHDRDHADQSPSAYCDYERAVALYTAAGGQETVQRVVIAISRLSRRLDVFYRHQLDQLGLTPGEWTVLTTLAQDGRGAGAMPSRLADICGVSPSTMTHRLNRMVERGWVERAVDPDNRTRMRVVLADPGWEMFRHAILDAEVVESDILSTLDGPQRRQLATLLETVVAGLGR